MEEISTKRGSFRNPFAQGAAGLPGLLLFGLLSLDPFVNLLTMHSNIAGGVDAYTDLIAFHPQHSNGDVVTNHQGFTNSTG
jgi:hypothetical protein